MRRKCKRDVEVEIFGSFASLHRPRVSLGRGGGGQTRRLRGRVRRVPALQAILASHWSADEILSCDWCRQYGEGAWEILEDCRRYINCSLQGDGSYLQHNMQCPGDLVFANEYGDCVEYDKATDCKVFQDTPCLHQVTRDNIPPCP